MLRNFELARLSLFRFTFLGQDNPESSWTSCNVEHEDGCGKVKGGQKSYTWTFSTFTDTKQLHRLVTGRIREEIFKVNNFCTLKTDFYSKNNKNIMISTIDNPELDF